MFKLFQTATLAALALATVGCATRGAVQFNCAGFDGFTHPLEPSKLVRDIQSDQVREVDVLAVERESILPRDAMAIGIRNLVRDRSQKAAPGARADVLLLSGGGQWGAFGAGFLSSLHDQSTKNGGGDRYPDFGVITGVSTGGLQSLFVAIGNEKAFKALQTHYAPKSEGEVVDRDKATWKVAVKGSMAGLAPLRRKIEAALCTDGDPAKGCDLIDQLARSGRAVYIGFVEAKSGKFIYADAIAIARSASVGADPVAARRNAQQCLTGVAMASAAMPVFFQQVRIGQRAYYDGGVRQSVFEARTAERLQQAMTELRAEKGFAAGRAGEPALYVVRNGPTTVMDKPEPDPDEKADALTAAFRAEAIVVNELEVSSIAALRLARPTGAIRLVTADGWEREPALCTKPPKVMFDPTFMQCLQEFGRIKAARTVPWISLSMLPLDAKAIEQ